MLLSGKVLSDSHFFLHVIFTLSFYLSLVVTCGSFYRIRWMFILIAAGDFCLLIDRFYRFRLFSLLLLVLRNNCWRMNEFRLGCFLECVAVSPLSLIHI